VNKTANARGAVSRHSPRRSLFPDSNTVLWHKSICHFIRDLLRRISGNGNCSTELRHAEFYTNRTINAVSTNWHLFVSFGKEWLSLRRFSRALQILSTVCSAKLCIKCT